MTDKALTQLRALRNTGTVNMANRKGVRQVAADEGYYELVIFIDESSIDEYSDLLMQV
jgi:hypothetical protein